MTDNTNPIPVSKKVEQNDKISIFDKLLGSDSLKDTYLPFERVQLPSQGVYYGNLMPDGYIEVRPMGVDVDKVIANQRIAQSGQMLNKIIEMCVKLPEGFDVLDMLVGDQYFLLYYLRGITHGSEYEFTTTCPHCGTKSIYDYDLQELNRTKKGPHKDHRSEPMPVKLPKLSEWIRKEYGTDDDIYANVRLMRIKDILAMSKKLTSDNNDDTFDPVAVSKARNRGTKQTVSSKPDVDNTYLNNFKLQIESFKIGNEVLQGPKRVGLIEKMHQADTSIIREFIDSITPGIDTIIEVTCQNQDCRKDYSINLPFGEDFFRSRK